MAATFADPRPVAVSVSAKAGHDKTIEVSWEFPVKTSPKITGAKIFRGTRPFTSYSEIAGDMPVSEVKAGTNSITDTLTQNNDYFYAVIAVTENGDYKTVIPGMNTTVRGVRPKVPAPKSFEQKEEKKNSARTEAAEDEARKDEENLTEKTHPAFTDQKKEDSYTEGGIRNAPLPNPGILLGFDGERTKMSGRANEEAKKLGRSYSRPASPFKSPYFFEEDMFSPDGGDEYILFETLRAGLAQKKYDESVKILTEYLSVHRTPETTARAEFYLGESYYFCRQYEAAIRCFLEVQDAFPELAKQWIDSSLDQYTIE